MTRLADILCETRARFGKISFVLGIPNSMLRQIILLWRNPVHCANSRCVVTFLRRQFDNEKWLHSLHCPGFSCTLPVCYRIPVGLFVGSLVWWKSHQLFGLVCSLNLKELLISYAYHQVGTLKCNNNKRGQPVCMEVSAVLRLKCKFKKAKSSVSCRGAAQKFNKRNEENTLNIKPRCIKSW